MTWGKTEEKPKAPALLYPRQFTNTLSLGDAL